MAVFTLAIKCVFFVAWMFREDPRIRIMLYALHTVSELLLCRLRAEGSGALTQAKAFTTGTAITLVSF